MNLGITNFSHYYHVRVCEGVCVCVCTVMKTQIKKKKNKARMYRKTLSFEEKKKSCKNLISQPDWCLKNSAGNVSSTGHQGGHQIHQSHLRKRRKWLIDPVEFQRVLVISIFIPLRHSHETEVNIWNAQLTETYGVHALLI